MYRVAILAPAPGKLSAMLGDFLSTSHDNPSVSIADGTRLADFSGEYDLFVVLSSEIDISSVPPDLSCRVLLLPGSGEPAVFSQIPSKWAVSFGLSGKDSITVSSLAPDFAVLSLQRELVALDGQVIEQQEIPLLMPHATSAPGLMALYGSLLLLGVAPERIAV